MAKKKAATKAASKKKPAPKAKASKPKPRPRTSSPRSQVLPGMEQVRNRSLDRICEGISDVRNDKNRLIAEEKDLMNQAVQVMTKDAMTVYRFSGVELVLVPGDVHLRVRTLKVKANTDAPATEAQDDAPGVTDDEMTPDDERLAEEDGGAE